MTASTTAARIVPQFALSHSVIYHHLLSPATRQQNFSLSPAAPASDKREGRHFLPSRLFYFTFTVFVNFVASEYFRKNSW